MKTKINLSDLVMLQMMGSLDEYVGELTNNTGKQDEIVEETRQRASTPKVFDEIVKKSINAQFGQTYTIVRELAQNGKDAYDKEVRPKKVEFTAKPEQDDFVLTCRDEGVGMAPIEVVRDLLVPYNSGKDKDHDKIGEHGIGWYSIMDFANRVEVVSGKKGVTTKAIIGQANGNWQATIETSEGDFKGTEVRAFAEPKNANLSEIREQLSKNIGLCDCEEVNITLNGEQINTLGKSYRLGGQVLVDHEGITDTLDLSFRRDGAYSKKVTLTQDGLFIKEEDIPFAEGSLHYSFMNSLMEEGFNFWFDLPTNVGLTIGRNNVVARDRTSVYKAMIPTLEQCVLDVVLEDEDLVNRLDTKISYWITNIFSNTYEIEAIKREEEKGQKSPSRIIRYISGAGKKNLEQKIANGEVERPDTIVVVHGDDHFRDLKTPETSDAKKMELERIMKEYYDSMSTFSLKLFEKQFIRAKKYVGGQTQNIRVSISDMIQSYTSGILFDARWHEGEEIDGIYVDSSLEVVRTVLNKLDELSNRRQKRKAAISFSSEAYRPDRNSSQGFSQTEKDTTIIEITNRTNLQKIKEITEAEKCGQEYQGFLEVANYIDELVSKANSLDGSPVMMHYREKVFFSEIAHTDRKGISFNFADETAYSFVQRIRTGSLDSDTMMKLTDVLVHEKAHCKRSEYDATPEHGRKFYEEDKKQVRENFITYCLQKGVDPLKDANALLSKHDYTVQTDLKRFGDLVEKYTSPEPVEVKSK